MKNHKKPFFTARRNFFMVVFIVIIITLLAFILLDGKNIAVVNPHGEVADKQKDLIVFTVLLGAVIIVPVFVMLFSFAWKYREGNTKAKYMPEADGNRIIETIWWVIPLIIIVVLSVVTWYSTHDLDPYKKLQSDKKAITIKVVALQWKWLFIYPNQGIATVNEVRFPEDTPVNFELTADSPMSAFWIPNLGTQTYAMNGMTSKLSLEAHDVGQYRGSNTNISGEGYAQMHFNAIAMTDVDFSRWVKNIAESENHLDWAKYEELAKPNKNQPIVYYMLHEPALYDMILAKYMGHGGSQAQSESHSMMNHEGMH